MKMRYFFIALAAFALGFGIAWLFGGGRSISWFSQGVEKAKEREMRETDFPSAATGTPVALSSAGENSFIVEEQVAGDMVTVLSVAVAQDTWVAIEEEREGARVSVLGATRVQEGEHEEVRVELLRALAPGGSYAVVLRGDDGIAGFDRAKDTPLTDASGEIIRKRFNLSPAPLAAQRDGCVISGCNSEECTDGDTPVLSVCVSLPQFACYKTGVCEKQTSGQCGWTETEELKQCLAQYE